MDTNLKESKEINNIEEKKQTLCHVDVIPEFKCKLSLSPKLIDDYAVDRERKITIGRESHKYLKEAFLQRGGNVQFDLDQGLTTFDPRPTNEGLGQIEQYIIWRSNQIKSNNLNEVINDADVVCWRGNITKIAASPYELGGLGWKFLIEKFENVLFFREIDTDEKIEQQKSISEWETKCNYWGHKFETFIFAEKGKEPTPNEPVTTWEEMGAVFSTTFPSNNTEKELKLFYAAEMDGLDSNNEHVEVKTHAYKLFNGQWFQKKAMKWWIQSTIVGIDNIIVGFRTNKGMVFKLQKVDLSDLRVKCTEWNGDVCLRAAQHVFNTVRNKYDELVKSDELLLIERKPNKKAIKYTVVSKNNPPVEILSDEFKKKFQTVTNSSEADSVIRTKRKADDQSIHDSDIKIGRQSDD